MISELLDLVWAGVRWSVVNQVAPHVPHQCSCTGLFICEPQHMQNMLSHARQRAAVPLMIQRLCV
jgi:hypothetical protein